RLAEVEAALANRELVAVETAHGRPGRAVALLVVGAAVAGAAEAGEALDRREGDQLVPRLQVLRLLRLLESVRLHRAAEVRAAVRDDREAGLLAEQAVVA